MVYVGTILVYVLIGAVLFQLIRYAVKCGTLEALRQFRAEGGFTERGKEWN